MQSRLTIYDPAMPDFDKEAPDYMPQLCAWSMEREVTERALWDAMSEVLYAAHYKLMETSGGYAVDYAAVEKLDASIDAVLEAMPPHAKAHFDTLMQRPCER